MAIKLKSGKYKCGYCTKEYAKLDEAETCKESHNLIYLSLSKDDLHRLIQFIYSKDDRLLGDNLVDRLQSYMKGSFTQEIKTRKETWEERNATNA